MKIIRENIIIIIVTTRASGGAVYKTRLDKKSRGVGGEGGGRTGGGRAVVSLAPGTDAL